MLFEVIWLVFLYLKKKSATKYFLSIWVFITQQWSNTDGVLPCKWTLNLFKIVLILKGNVKCQVTDFYYLFHQIYFASLYKYIYISHSLTIWVKHNYLEWNSNSNYLQRKANKLARCYWFKPIQTFRFVQDTNLFSPLKTTFPLKTLLWKWSGDNKFKRIICRKFRSGALVIF